MSKRNTSNNRQVHRTKSWILEALIKLMDKKSYSKITVSDICLQAGIARSTFYCNFNSKNELSIEYMKGPFSIEIGSGDGVLNLPNIILTLDYSYIIKHKKNLKKLLLNLELTQIAFSIGPDAMDPLVTNYNKQLSGENYFFCRYKLYYQLSGILHVFSDWFLNDMPYPIEKLATILNDMAIPQGSTVKLFPKVMIKIIK